MRLQERVDEAWEQLHKLAKKTSIVSCELRNLAAEIAAIKRDGDEAELEKCLHDIEILTERFKRVRVGPVGSRERSKNCHPN